MRKDKLKIVAGVITFIIGFLTVALFTYRALTVETINNQIARPIDIKQSEQSKTLEEEVYIAVLGELFLKGNSKMLVISDETMFYSNSEYLKENSLEQRIQRMKQFYESAAEDTLKDYETKMHTSSKINFDFKLPIKYVFIDKEGVSKGKEGGIPAFYRKYPDAEGMIEFSAVGFNAEKNQAFVSVDFTHCPLCGFGSSLVLEKIDGNWQIVKNYGGWVS